MAHFAQLNADNVVTKVIVIANEEITDSEDVEQEEIGQIFCTALLGGNWMQTSYNHSFRKNFAGVGFKYDESKDAFIPPQPFASWLLNESTCIWEAPVSIPDNENIYIWNEETTNWDLVE